jgi:DNA-binding beta-propeller fold protein YncE
MLHSTLKRPALLVLAVAAVTLFVMCEDDDSPTGPTSGKKNFAMAFGTQQASYIGTTSLDQGEEDGSSFYQHDRALMFVWGDWFFVLEGFTTGILYKYTFDSDNNLTSPEQLSFGAGAMTTHLTIASTTKAYASLHSLGKIAIINPTTMTKTGEIDLTAYAAGADGSPDPSSAIIRGNYLFVALSQTISMMSAHDTVGCVAVIDITADTLVKVISDERVECLGNIEGANGTVFMDDNDNIYFNSPALWGFQPGLTEGFLRINDGETEFDPSYSFHLTTTTATGVTGEMVMCGLRMGYANGSTVYTSLMAPALMSENPDFMNDRALQPAVLDMEAKTITALDAPATTPWLATAFCVEEDGQVLYALNDGGSSSAGIYRYNPVSGEMGSTPVLEADMNIFFIKKLED